MSFCEQRVHQKCLEKQEMIRQSAQPAGCSAASARASDIRYFRSVLKSALECGVDPGQALTALAELRAAPSESFTRSDSSEFCVVGGQYSVEVSATFAEDGIVVLKNRAGDVLLTLTENGSVVVDLDYGSHIFDGANFTDLVASITG